MTKQFIDRIMCEQTVDTRKYRYRAMPEGNMVQIIRLPINMLGTVYAYRQWEIVKVFYECRTGESNKGGF